MRLFIYMDGLCARASCEVVQCSYSLPLLTRIERKDRLRLSLRFACEATCEAVARASEDRVCKHPLKLGRRLLVPLKRVLPTRCRRYSKRLVDFRPPSAGPGSYCSLQRTNHPRRDPEEVPHLQKEGSGAECQN